MKIDYLKIVRFKSLFEIELERVGQLNIFIGKNSSGKSNLLEGLSFFFENLDVLPIKEFPQVKENLWYQHDTDHQIQFIIHLHITAEEITESLPPGLSEPLLKDNKEHLILKIHRVLDWANKKWLTNSLEIAQFTVIKYGDIHESTADEPSLTPDGIDLLMKYITSTVAKSFLLVGASRAVSSGPVIPGQRHSLIDSHIIKQFIDLKNAQNPLQHTIARSIMDTYSRIVGETQSLDTRQSTVIVWEGNRQFLLSSIGGGNQELLRMLVGLLNTHAIHAIEEPEIHLHADIARRLFNELIVKSQSSQLFISTHSTIFVDQCQLEKIWMIRKQDGMTTIFQIETPEDLKMLGLELGIRPSDVFFARSFLFVEGKTEVNVLPIWSKKLGIHLNLPSITLVPIEGSGNTKHQIPLRKKMSESIGCPMMLLLDKDAESEAASAIGNGIITTEEVKVLEKGAIEDYYPFDILLEELLNRYPDLKQREDDLKKAISKHPRTNPISGLIKQLINERESDAWKVPIGLSVAERMTRTQIDNELVVFLFELAKRFELAQSS